MRALAAVIASLTVVGLCGAAAAQKPKPKPQAGKPALGSIGTNQMPGSVCKFNQAYTLGKAASNAINVSILGAEYTATRVRTGKSCLFPKAETKLLVVHYTLHNPVPREQWYQGWVRFTAVMAGSPNVETREAYTEAAPHAIMDLRLKPGQKIACYSVLEVPGVGQVEKLILENVADSGSPVARYPLAGLVRKIGAPYADPADATGTTPLKVLTAPMGQAYEIAGQDVAVLNVEQVEGTGDPLEPQETDKVYVLVTFQTTNRLEEGSALTNFNAGWMESQIVDTDGGKVGTSNVSLRAASIAAFDPGPAYGEAATFRKAYVISRGVKLDYVRLRDSESREVRINLAGFTTK